MTETTAGGVYRHELNSRSVGFPGVLMQSVAQISPTLGIFYTIAFVTSQTGITAPLTYVVAFVLCLTLAVPLASTLPGRCRLRAATTPTSAGRSALTPA